MDNKREVGLDILRSIAAIFVVSVHFFLNTNFYESNIIGNVMYLQVLLQALFMSCIPLFLLLTGYFSNKTDISLKYYKKIIPIIIIYILYSLVAIIYRKYILLEAKGLKDWLLDLLTFRAISYSWYVNMYIGLFLISPFLNIIFNNLKNKKERQILISVFLLISAVPDFLNGRFFSFIQFPNYWVDFYPIGFYFVGSYIREYKPKLKKSYVALFILLILAFETFFEVYAAKGTLFVSYMGTFGSLIRFALAVLIFLMLYDVQIKNKMITTIAGTVSILSLDIYLASYTTDKVVYSLVYRYIFTTQERIVYWIIPIVLSTFLMALTAGIIRSKVISVRQTGKNIISNNKNISM